jgi:hypothetical protein
MGLFDHPAHDIRVGHQTARALSLEIPVSKARSPPTVRKQM